MVRPPGADPWSAGARAAYAVGCVGEIVGLEELEDGRYNIVLLGLNRFRDFARRYPD